MKRFFVYELKKSFFVILALTIAATAVYLVNLIVNMEYDIPYNLCLSTISIIGGGLAAGVPVWKLYYKMKKRSVDLYYSLPLSHISILAVKFLVGLIAVFVPYTIAYWVGAFTTIGASEKAFNAVCYIPLFFSSLLPICILYVLSSFLYTRGNTAVDGAAIVVMSGFALAMLFTVLGSVVYKLSDKHALYGYYYLPFVSLDFVTSEIGKLFLKDNFRYYDRSNAENVNIIVGITVTTLCAVGAGVWLFLDEKRTKAERVGQITESLFGYKTMVPFYAFSGAYLLTADSLVFAVLIAAAAYALCVLYKRTPKIGKVSAIATSAAFAVGVALSYIVEIPHAANFYMFM